MDTDTQKLDELAELIRGRRTITLFENKPVPRELLLEAIELARWAPNHHVTEPWRFYLLGEFSRLAMVELIRRIAIVKKGDKAGAFKAEAAAAVPGWLVVTCRRSADEVLQQEDYAACSCAIQNLMLYLWQAGVGCKWATSDVTLDEGLVDLLGIDADKEYAVGIIRYGYPKIVPRQSRSALTAVVTELD
jgi:nitroreductase